MGLNDFWGWFSGLFQTAGNAATSAASSLMDKARPLLDMIGRHESAGGNYNIIYGGQTANLTSMTINQVFNLQNEMLRRGLPSTAVGKYQIIKSTLRGLVDELGYTGNEIFSPQVQDTMGLQLLKRRGLERYLNGSMSQSAFMRAISQEWASLPKDGSGLSYYAGDGLNRALASAADVVSVLQRVRRA